MTLRKAITYLHLWLGLASGLVLSVIGITGSLYVFEPEIVSYLERAHYKTAGTSLLFKDDIAIASFIENNTQKNIHSIQWPQRGRETYMFKLIDEDSWYYFDQTTSKITKSGTGFGNAFFSFLLDLHTTLTMGDTGRIITGISSLLFALLMLTSGLYLWWPHKIGRKNSSFKIKWKASPKRFNYDLHNVSGFYLFVPLFVMGITGAAFYFQDEVQWTLDKITFSEPAPKNVWEEDLKNLPGNAKALSTEEALKEMDKYYPVHYKRNMWMNTTTDGTISFAYQKYNKVHSGADTRIFVKANGYTGKILSEQNPDKLPRGAAVLAKWHLPLHFGEFGGIITRIIWFIIGLTPALLTWTGTKIWLGKRNKKKSTRKLQPQY